MLYAFDLLKLNGKDYNGKLTSNGDQWQCDLRSIKPVEAASWRGRSALARRSNTVVTAT
jgi:hypothetical protein